MAPVLVVLLGLVLPLSLVGLASPGFAEAHFAEDMAVESLTAMTFLAAALVGTAAMRQQGRHFWTLAVVGFSCVAFLDEISFGERIVGFAAPTVDEVKIDAVHDVLQLGANQVRDLRHSWIVDGLLLGLVLLALGLAAGLAMRRQWARRLIRQPDVPILAGAAGFVAVAQVLDLELRDLGGKSRIILGSYVEEHLELGAAVLLLVYAWRRLRVDARDEPGPGTPTG